MVGATLDYSLRPSETQFETVTETQPDSLANKMDNNIDNQNLIIDSPDVPLEPEIVE